MNKFFPMTVGTLMFTLILLIGASCEPEAVVPQPAVERTYTFPEGIVLIDTVRPPQGRKFIGRPLFYENTVYILSADGDIHDSNPSISVYTSELEPIHTEALPTDFDVVLSTQMQLRCERLVIGSTHGLRVYNINGGGVPRLLWANTDRVGDYPGALTLGDTEIYSATIGASLLAYNLQTGLRREIHDFADQICPGNWTAKVNNITFDVTSNTLFISHAQYCPDIQSSEADLYAIDLQSGSLKWRIPSNEWRKEMFGVHSGRSSFTIYDNILAAVNGRSVVGIDAIAGKVLWKVDSLGGSPLDITINPGIADDSGRAFFADNGTGPVGVIDLTTGKEVWGSLGQVRRFMQGVQVIDKDFLYTSSGGAFVYRINAATGQVKWALQSPLRDREDTLVNVPEIVGDELYFSDLRQLYRLRMRS